jgi:dachs protein
LTLASTSTFPILPSLKKVVQEALRQQVDTGYPQAIILSGLSGSGKTYTSLLILKQLFLLAGGGGAGAGSDAFKHLSASITVLRSLGTASTVLNRDSSRVGHFIEVQVTEGTVYRTKVHCYFLDHTRVVNCAPEEKNYHIFYQMLAGLSEEERERLHLRNHSIHTLRYLKRADTSRTDTEEDKRRFLEWKAALGN